MNDSITVLVVDDEAVERKAVMEILRLCRDNLRMIEAVNGLSAVEAARKQPIDMVFMDMAMPLMNGLDALREMRALQPSLFSVMLTAYDEFEYAVQALKLGVEDYVLKPARKSKIEGCIQAFEESRRKRAQEQAQPPLAALSMESIFPYLEDNLLSGIVMGDSAKGHIQQLLRYFFPQGGRYALSLCDHPDDDADMAARLEDLRFRFGEAGLPVAGANLGRKLMVLTTCSESDFEKWQREKLLPLLPSDFAWRFSPPVEDGARLGEAYRRLAYAGDSEKPASLLQDGEKEIAVKIATIDEEGALALFRRIFAQTEHSDASPDALRQQLLSMCIVVDHYLGKMVDGVTFGDTPDFREMKTLEEMYHAVQFFVATRVDLCHQGQQPKIHKLIRNAVNDLELHYADGLYSLNAAAQNLSLSAGYLSKLFKLRVGMTFTEYLSEVRVDEAKKLLKNTSLDIAEIAEKCGFNSANYFCKVFRKQTGTSASDYREGRGT